MNSKPIESMSVMLKEKVKSDDMLLGLANSINDFFTERARLNLLIIELSDKIKDEEIDEVKEIKMRSLKLHQELLENNTNSFEELCVRLSDILKEYAEIVFEENEDREEKERFIAFCLEYSHVSENLRSAFEEILSVYYNTKEIKQGVFKFEIICEDRDFIAETEELKALLSAMLSDYLSDTFEIVIV